MTATPGRGAALRRLALELAIGYAAAWGVGLAYGYILKQGSGWRTGAQWERSMLTWANAHPLPGWLDQIMLFTPYLGTNLTILPLVIVIGLVLWRKYDMPALAAHLVLLCVGMLSMNPTMKALLARPRPDLFPLRGLYSWASYPSGHMILVTALYFTLALLLYRWKGWLWPFAVAAFVVVLSGYSRVYLAVHWPTDLIGGCLMGIVWLLATWRAFSRFQSTTA